MKTKFRNYRRKKPHCLQHLIQEKLRRLAADSNFFQIWAVSATRTTKGNMNIQSRPWNKSPLFNREDMLLPFAENGIPIHSF